MSGNYQDFRQRSERRYPNGEKIPDSVVDQMNAPAPPEEGSDKRRRSRGCRTGTDNPSFAAAFVLIAVGAIFFLSNLGLFRAHDIFVYWPAILIVLGLFRLRSSRGPLTSFWAAGMIFIGLAFLTNNMGLLRISAGVIWPLALVGCGIYLLANGFGRNRTPGSWIGADFASGLRNRIHDEAIGASRASGDSSSFDAASDSVLREWTLFGGVKRIISSPDFRGGELMSIFGGVEVDLRRAQIVPRSEPVVIDANTAFGGVVIKVPNNWRVAVRGVGVFGGYVDKTIHPRPDAGAPLLVVTGYAAFGGVTVE